jgi:ATP-binding cassette, subfamily B, bacterial PglK
MRSTRRELSQAWKLLSKRGHRTLIWYGFSLTVLSGLDAIALVLVSQLFTGNESMMSVDFSRFGVVVLLFIGRTCLSTAVSWWAVKVLTDEEVDIGTRNLTTLVARGLAEPLSESDYFNAVDRGPSSLTQGLMLQSVTICSEIATAIVILGTLLVLDFPTAVSSSIYFLAVALLQNKWLSRSAAQAGDVVAGQTAAVYESLLDGFKLRKLLRVMPSASFEPELQSRRKLPAESRARVAFLGTLPRYTMELVLSIGLVVVCGVAYLVDGDKGAIEAVVIFGVAGFRLLPSINRVQGLILYLFSTVPTAQLAHMSPSPQSIGTAPNLPSNEGEILALEHVSFRYPGSSVNAVRDISITFERGLQYAIVGPSGAGKTTFLDILLGLLQPTQGTITKAADLRVGYVPQDSHLERVSFNEKDRS